MNEERDDLEKLIQIAEKVSETVNDLNTKNTNLRFMFILAVLGLYISVGAFTLFLGKLKVLLEFSFTLYLVGFALVIFLAIGSFYFIFQYVAKIKRQRHELESEKEILRELLVMIFEYKDHIYIEKMSFVERAILDIRLKRIKFSTKL